MRFGKDEKKIQDTKQSSEPDSEMTQMLESSDREFKIAMINMLKVEKVDNTCDQMGNFSREMEMIRNKWKC